MPKNDMDMSPLAVTEPSEKPVLLVVDDQPSNIQTLYALFRADYEVCMATNGADALAFCQVRQPDLILLDVVMPEMNGYEVCRRLKTDLLTQNIPVIFITGQNDPLEEAHAFDEGGVDFISKPFHVKVVSARVRTHLTLKRQTDLLRSMALIDGLTHVANRRHFDATLEAEMRRCARARRPLALLMIDVDFFKRFNDRYGHLAGDASLQAVAGVLKSGLTRSHDQVARFGGEEFTCILPETPLEGALQKALQLEQDVRALAIPHADSDAAGILTISIGVAVLQPVMAETPAELTERADTQLYLAKRAGRGQVSAMQINASPPEDAPPMR